MFIDADCHISSRQTGPGIDIDELLRRMDEVGVDRAVCWPMVSYTREMASDNLAIYEGVRAFPDRIINLGGVNPLLGLEEAQDELRALQSRCTASKASSSTAPATATTSTIRRSACPWWK
jgi:hypothetical protein